jgi:Peroxiredoxin
MSSFCCCRSSATAIEAMDLRTIQLKQQRSRLAPRRRTSRSRRPRIRGLALGVPGAARGPRLLPRGLEPGLFGSVGAYQELLPEFRRLNAELVGISVDGIWSHLAFAKDRNLHFPLLADFEPKGEVSRRYQVYRSSDGTSERALYVIDADGIVHWSYVSRSGSTPAQTGFSARSRSWKAEPRHDPNGMVL